jgi:hypothetical protein
VLSIVFLGRRLLLRHELVLTERLLYDALRNLRGLLLEALPV